MPLIGKEPFKYNGDHRGIERGGRDFTENFTINLYYDLTDSYFYFQTKDLQEMIPGTKLDCHDFKRCQTRQQASAIVEFELKQIGEEKRVVFVILNVSSTLKEELAKVAKPHTEGLLNLGRYANSLPMLSLEYKNYLECTTIKGGVYYSPCKNNWDRESGGNGHLPEGARFVWTPEIGEFLKKTQEEITGLGAKVFGFLNSSDSAEELEGTMGKVASLLGKQSLSHGFFLPQGYTK